VTPLPARLSMKKALLLIDLQNDARDVMTPGFIRTLREVIRRCEAKDIPVIHVLTEYTEDELPLLNREKGLSIFMKGTPGAEEIAEIKSITGGGHHYIVKRHYDAFYGTRLDGLLKKLKIETLLITGLYTHWCVLSTVFSAYSRNYRVHLIRGCVLSHHPDLDHLLLKHVFEKQTDAARVISPEEI